MWKVYTTAIQHPSSNECSKLQGESQNRGLVQEGTIATYLALDTQNWGHCIE